MSKCFGQRGSRKRIACDTNCHLEDFENAGVIFGAGMTWRIDAEFQSVAQRSLPPARMAVVDRPLRGRCLLTRANGAFAANALGDRVPPNVWPKVDRPLRGRC